MDLLSESARITAGIALLAAVTVTSGGAFVARVATGAQPATDFQRSFYRAGHGHAGVLIILGLVCLLLSEATSLTGAWYWLASTGVLASAIVLPARFFLSAIGPGRTGPNKAVLVLVAGAVLLIVSLVVLGVGLLLG